jgi:hypothetical protein
MFAIDMERFDKVEIESLKVIHQRIALCLQQIMPFEYVEESLMGGDIDDVIDAFRSMQGEITLRDGQYDEKKTEERLQLAKFVALLDVFKSLHTPAAQDKRDAKPCDPQDKRDTKPWDSDTFRKTCQMITGEIMSTLYNRV